MNKKDISVWEDIQAVAQHLGVESGTISQWKSRGYVPPSRQYELMHAAEEYGVFIQHGVLHRMWKKRKIKVKEEA